VSPLEPFYPCVPIGVDEDYTLVRVFRIFLARCCLISVVDALCTIFRSVAEVDGDLGVRRLVFLMCFPQDAGHLEVLDRLWLRLAPRQDLRRIGDA